MRLSIIPIDGAVVTDGVGHMRLSWEGTPADIHALQWFGDYGWIEYNDGKPNEDITLLPDWVFNAQVAWEIANQPPPPPGPPTAEYNRLKATELLFQSDWVENPSVRNTSNNPHITNTAELDDYRMWLRRLAVSPVEGHINWPTMPDVQWQS